MNKAKLKSYAPQARKDFLAAVTARANLLGLSDKAGTLDVATSQPQGDVTVIAGQAWPVKVHTQRDQLIARIRKDGFVHTMEAIAYTWFNRFAALRYMELHDYLGHGHRALSSTSGGLPDILTHATDLTNELPGLNAVKVTELKLAGNRDGELYRMLLVAQCNALSRAMPFLFERIDDDSELLLPDNLLRSDSVIAKLVEEIPEEDWAEVEIIGWLYQFYISEKKDQVIGKVVKSEDIPAATQLFTPNWIVQYLVQNSVGRLWLMANPQSTLANEWPYYITPAEQTPEVQAQLDALIQTRVREDGETLNPESVTVLDPACGSGHILVVAYDVLKAIYLERGYQPRAIPRLILEKNLYGLDIDDRAAQMAGFALLMKARADDRRLFSEPTRLNVLALQESRGLDVETILRALQDTVGRVSPQGVTRHPAGTFADHDLFPGTRPQMSLGEVATVPGLEASGYAALTRPTVTALITIFEHAKTFGSLIQIPHALKTHLAVLPEMLALVKQSGDMYAIAAADDLLPLVEQAQVLAMQFDAVVANPPYMGRKFVEPGLKAFLLRAYSDFDGDVFSAFMIRNIDFAREAGFLGFMSPMVWMFISSHEPLRRKIIEETNLASLIHLEYNASGEVRVPLCTFTLMRSHVTQYAGSYIRLTEFGGYDNQGPKTLEAISNPHCGWFFVSRPDDFNKIPGSPVAYWISNKIRELFVSNPCMGEMCEPRQGLATADNDRFLRMWSEVSFNGIAFNIESRHGALQSQRRWFPHLKGGDFRKWYGNHEWLVDWREDGHDIRNFKDSSGKVKSRPQGVENYFRNCVSWSDVTSSSNSFRFDGPGFIPNVVAPVIFESKADLRIFLLAGNNCFYNYIAKVLNPTLHFHVGYFSTMPFPEKLKDMDLSLADRLVDFSKDDWDSFETSWNFKVNALMSFAKSRDLKQAWDLWNAICQDRIVGTKELEEENNRLFIDAYNLQDELAPEVPESQITLARADREKDCQRLISYAVGCMMGRYSLDEPGLIYAHAGNVGFEPARYATFPADADGIVPITDELWFADDAPSRIREFLRAVWGPDTLEENMAWLAESLGQKPAETPDETIRRYIADKFFKDHLQTYKKRPIYWLFSSGKQGAFQALVYLHRYHEGTLARLRAEYVVPLTGKIQSRIEMVQKDALAASSTAARNKLAKEVEKLKKKHVELLAYDEQLRHYADMRINLDLDDGVKVNYGKFGDLLDSVKVVTGGAEDD